MAYYTMYYHMQSSKLYLLVSRRIAFVFISLPSHPLHHLPFHPQADTKRITDPNLSFPVSPTALQTQKLSDTIFIFSLRNK